MGGSPWGTVHSECLSDGHLGRPLVRAVRTFFGDHPSLPCVSVYFQGCDAVPKCNGCHNPETWAFDESFGVDFERLVDNVTGKLSKLLLTSTKVALALVGGEPLSLRNRSWALLLATIVKQKFGERIVTILYTWRTLEELESEGIDITPFDELVLGRYVPELHTGGFPASSNQLYVKTRDLRHPATTVSTTELAGFEAR